RRQRAVPGIQLPSELREVGIDRLTAMLNIGTIRGGVQGATVPDRCEEEVLRGMIPGEAFGDVEEELIAVLEGVKAADADRRYEVEVINSREGYVMPPDHPYIQEAKEFVGEVLGRELPFRGTLASTDMNYQVNDGKMPCFCLGVGGPYSNGHKQDENVAVDEIVELAKIVAFICMRKLR
ncbi:MAG: M20/M25/M40 family metallo-hydrolase, partial [Candidatus Bathyarchaeia archaeon]